MTITEHGESEALLGARYTVEELAVLADLYDLESLPGTPAIELSMDLRSLATRCLIARGVLRMPDDGGVEVTQPHATLLAGIFDAPVVFQVSRLEGTDAATATWFDLGEDCVRVVVDEGLVDMDAFLSPAASAIDRTLGIDVRGVLPAHAAADVVVEITRTELHTTPANTVRAVVARVEGTWYSLADDNTEATQ